MKGKGTPVNKRYRESSLHIEESKSIRESSVHIEVVRIEHKNGYTAMIHTAMRKSRASRGNESSLILLTFAKAKKPRRFIEKSRRN
jgi:hypothetical protein